jgi:hypothetical protein
MLSGSPDPGQIVAITIGLFASHATPLLFFGKGRDHRKLRNDQKKPGLRSRP